LSLYRTPLPSAPTAVLGSVKSGAGWPTFKFVCGTGGTVLVGGGVGVGVGCARAIDAAASKKTKLMAFLIIVVLQNDWVTFLTIHVSFFLTNSLERSATSEATRDLARGPLPLCWL